MVQELRAELAPEVGDRGQAGDAGAEQRAEQAEARTCVWLGGGHRYAGELLATGTGKIGYLLKDRISDVGEFIDALARVANGGTVLDPQVVRQLLARSRQADPPIFTKLDLPPDSGQYHRRVMAVVRYLNS